MNQPAIAAPQKICPHCGAVSQTFEKKCPNCGKGYKKRTALKVFTGLVVLGLVSVVGCAALLGTAANEAVKELDAEQEAHAISKSQFNSVEIGQSRAAVVKQLGKKPEDSQEFKNEGFLDEAPSTSSCIYYNRTGGEFGDVFQFCFDDGKLSSKNSY